MEIAVWNANDPDREMLFSFESALVPRIGEGLAVNVDLERGAEWIVLSIESIDWQIGGEGVVHCQTLRPMEAVALYVRPRAEDATLFAKLQMAATMAEEI